MNSSPPSHTTPSSQIGLHNSDLLIPLIQNFSDEKKFAVGKGRTITQQAFLQDVLHFAELLPEADSAFNLCEDRYYFLVVFCALLTKGQINLLPPNRQNTTINDLAKDYANTYCIVDTAEGSNNPPERNIKSLNVFQMLNCLVKNKRHPEQLTPPSVNTNQTVAILFTSGSTGKPKPNPKTWGALVGSAQTLKQRFTDFSPSTTLVATVPSQHMYGLETTIMMALRAGVILNTEKPFFPSEAHSLLHSISSPIVLITTPTHLRALVNSELKMPPLATIISATSPLDLSLAQEAEACFASQLFEIYGCTEAGSIATRRLSQTQSWQLLNGFSLKINQNNAEINATHFDETVILQDLVEPIDEQYFLLCGRSSDMINVAGKRASLGDLTLQLQRIQGVKDAVIFLPNEGGSQRESRPVALVVSERSEKEILVELAQRIDAAFLPRPLCKVNELPRNETGKITAAALNSLWSQIRGKR